LESKKLKEFLNEEKTARKNFIEAYARVLPI